MLTGRAWYPEPAGPPGGDGPPHPPPPRAEHHHGVLANRCHPLATLYGAFGHLLYTPIALLLLLRVILGEGASSPDNLPSLNPHSLTASKPTPPPPPPPPQRPFMPPLYQPSRWSPPRKNGLQFPLARDQVGAMIFYPILTTSFYLIASFYLPDAYLPLVLGVYSALVVVSVACWFYVSLVDPSQPGGFACPCMNYTQGHSRYCASCRKSVPGLDHHCLWLNTCIGTRNYVFFFLLAVTGTLQFALQTTISILLLTHWFATTDEVPRSIERTVGKTLNYQAFMIVHTVAAGLACLSFASLCLFHGYLQTKGLGTYDWILRQRAPAPAPAAAATAATTSRLGTGTTAATRPIQQPTAAGSSTSININGDSSTTLGSISSMPSPPSLQNSPPQHSPSDYVALNVSQPVMTLEKQESGTAPDAAVMVEMVEGNRNGDGGKEP